MEGYSLSKEFFRQEEGGVLRNVSESDEVEDMMISAVTKGETNSSKKRYVNFSDPTSKKEEWSVEEDRFLANFIKQNGKNWIKISQMMNGRSPNSIKNRFYRHLRRKNENKFNCPVERVARLVFPAPHIDQTKSTENLLFIFEKEDQDTSWLNF